MLQQRTAVARNLLMQTGNSLQVSTSLLGQKHALTQPSHRVHAPSSPYVLHSRGSREFSVSPRPPSEAVEPAVQERLPIFRSSAYNQHVQNQRTIQLTGRSPGVEKNKYP